MAITLQGKGFWATENIDAQTYIFDALDTGRRKCFRRSRVEAQSLGGEKKIDVQYLSLGVEIKYLGHEYFLAHTAIWATVFVFRGPFCYRATTICAAQTLILWPNWIYETDFGRRNYDFVAHCLVAR